MTLLSLLIFLLMLTLIGKKLVLQRTLRLKLLLGTFFVERSHRIQMPYLQLLYGFFIDSVRNVPIDVSLLLHSHHLIIERFFFLDSRLDSLLRLLLQRFVIGSFNGKAFVLSQVRMLQLLLVELHLNLLHPLGVVKEILFSLGI